MKLALIQPKYPVDYKETIEVMEQLKTAPYNCPTGTDLLVLPEYSNCPGMPIDEADEMFSHCRRHNQTFIESIKTAARETGMTICTNMLNERSEGFANTTLVIDKSGAVIAEYDKTHLAYTEIDTMKLVPGKKPVFLDILGAKTTFAVCFELYFPEYFERLAAECPDIILCPSYQRSEESEILLKQAMGRALDSEAFIIRSSYSMGPDSKNGGTSYVVNPSGEILLNAGQQTGIFITDINPNEKRMRPLAHGLGKMSSREIVEKFRKPAIYRKNTMFITPDATKYPKVCAHRGFSGRIPENTLPAFASALAAGADEIEFDVRLTKDNKIIICHDDTVDRVSNGSGKVSELSFCEIRKLNAGEYMDWQDICFPTPKEVFELLGGSIIMNIHVYESGKDGFVISELKNLIEEYGIAGTVYFAAQEKEMKWCLELAPDINRCMLECFDEKRDISDIALEYMCSRVQHFYSVYSADTVKKATESGLINNLFFEDDPTKVASRLNDGIDTILTNYPDRIIPAVKNP